VLVGAAALALVAGCGGKKGAQTFTVDVDSHLCTVHDDMKGEVDVS